MAGVRISVAIDPAAIARVVQGIGKQARYAAAVALTRTAADIAAAAPDQAERELGGLTTPFTRRGLYTDPARRDQLVATVGYKRVQASYMVYQVRGGDRASAAGLLPLMEARQRKDGRVTYRYHPRGGRPINLGQDRVEAIRRVLDLLGRSSDAGTIAELWRAYQAGPDWSRLADRTRADYAECAGPLLRVFGAVQAAAISPAMIARYLRIERAGAPVRANREAALLSNLMNVAVERGDIDANPCRQVRRNREQPRTRAVDASEIAALAAWLAAQGGQRAIVGMMAEFAALTGARRAEFLRLAWTQLDGETLRLRRAKQRGGAEKIDRIEVTPPLRALLERARQIERAAEALAVFPSRAGRPYTEAGFKATWARLMSEALAAGIIPARFTFHDLRAHYVTRHRAERGALPDLHANPGTTARVYDRAREARRRAL